MAQLKFTLNGEAVTVEAAPDMPTLWLLRDVLGLTGTKFGCGKGLCGSCTIHVNGEPVRSCQTQAKALSGKAITTIEGLERTPLGVVQEAWVSEQVPQCGYCQPGQIMTAAALLKKQPNPDTQAIHGAFAGMLCRCGTYPRMVPAIQRAAEALSRNGAPRANPPPTPTDTPPSGRDGGTR